MNKNVLLSVLVLGAVAIVIAIFFVPFDKPFLKNDSSLVHEQKKSKLQQVVINYEKHQDNVFSNNEKKQRPKVKKIDPTLVYRGMDLYRRYILKLRDRSIKGKVKQVYSTGYRLVGGTINGNQFNIKVPEEAIKSSDLELEIIDTKTGEQKKINANFLQELSGLPKNSSFMVKIDLKNPQNIQTDVFLPRGDGAFSGIER